MSKYTFDDNEGKNENRMCPGHSRHSHNLHYIPLKKALFAKISKYTLIIQNSVLHQ
jgi:hypothetical protein